MNDGSYRNRQIISKVNTTTLVKLFVLHFLKEKNHYGNELIDKIEKSLNYRWKPSPGMVYPLLRDMEENLLIEGWWEEPDKKTKRNYKITENGLKHYEKIKSMYKPLLEESLDIIKYTLNEIYKY
ncbi:lineage-specific thermal regulator protein [Caloramator mitchellensis]|uniref:Lineage-specific thermal regulator protein n=1 Tax=Caloramator mitchellensis TaxID=908809 RepID=A0A0R3JTY7_CALMK|nr:PadR family transcriptional regulator [Caloramator mitchellensis]KRQ87014.1 lineage-specific thermal regulator protein [Caloramator mitchellensis]